MPTGIIFDIKRYALHDGPGTRTTVFLKSCPLQCQWCHNPEGISSHPQILYFSNRCLKCGDCIRVCSTHALASENDIINYNREKCTLCGNCVEICSAGALEIAGQEIDAREVIKIIDKDFMFYDESAGGVTFSGGEPLAQIEFLTALLLEAKKLKIHTVVDTSGFAPFSSFEKIVPMVDLFLYDIKSIDDLKHQHFTGVSNTLILENFIKLASISKSIIARVPLIPDFNNQAEQIMAIGKFVKTNTTVRQIDLLPYHTIAKEKYLRLGKPYALEQIIPMSNAEIIKLQNTLESLKLKVVVGG